MSWIIHSRTWFWPFQILFDLSLAKSFDSPKDILPPFVLQKDSKWLTVVCPMFFHNAQIFLHCAKKCLGRLEKMKLSLVVAGCGTVSNSLIAARSWDRAVCACVCEISADRCFPHSRDTSISDSFLQKRKAILLRRIYDGLLCSEK